MFHLLEFVELDLNRGPVFEVLLRRRWILGLRTRREVLYKMTGKDPLWWYKMIKIFWSRGMSNANV